MSAGIKGVLIGFILGTWFGFVMGAIVAAGGRDDLD